MSRNLSWDSIHTLSGFASGSVGWTLTLEVMTGRIWSPEIITPRLWQCRQACSGECPAPTTTCQSCSPMVRMSPSCRRRKPIGRALGMVIAELPPFGSRERHMSRIFCMWSVGMP